MTALCYSNRTAEREMPPTGRTMGRHRRTNPRHAGGNKAQQHCIETHLHEGMSKLKDYPIGNCRAGFACPKTQSKLFSGERTSPLQIKRQHYPRFDTLPISIKRKFDTSPFCGWKLKSMEES